MSTAIDFLKRFWNTLRHYFMEQKEGIPPCQRTILSFLPQNCNLALLNNQRPVALLCSNYKTLTDTQGSTWKHFPNKPELLCCDQDSYGYMNIFFSFRAVIDMCTFYNLNTGILSLGLGKTPGKIHSCSFSCQLYSLAIKPLLCRFRGILWTPSVPRFFLCMQMT